MSSIWQCPSCSTSNGPTDQFCIVCQETRPAFVPPAARTPVPVVVPTSPSGTPTPAQPSAAAPTSRGGARIPASYVLIAAAMVLVAGMAFVLGRALTTRDRGGPSALASPDLTLPADDTLPAEDTGSARASQPDSSSSSLAPSDAPSPPVSVPEAARRSVELVQRWVDAVTSQDWATARGIRPSFADMTDAGLEEVYGGLKEAEIVYASGSERFLYVASVAHESVESGDRTSVYCYTVAIDGGTQTIQVRDNGPQPLTTRPGWLPAADLIDVTSRCQDPTYE